MESNKELDIKAVIQLSESPELYKIVDFLNKNLKDKGLIFGLNKKNNKMNITIYETELR